MPGAVTFPERLPLTVVVIGVTGPIRRTTADLAALFTDLPRRQAPVTSAAPSAPASPGRFWPARVPVAPVAVLAVVVVLALLSGHPFRIAWVPVVAIIVVRLLVGGRGRRRCDRRAPR